MCSPSLKVLSFTQTENDQFHSFPNAVLSAAFYLGTLKKGSWEES
jgi:hypothetical protein